MKKREKEKVSGAYNKQLKEGAVSAVSMVISIITQHALKI